MDELAGDEAALAAWREIIEAQKRGSNVLRENFPIGSRVYWRSGGRICQGHVCRHTFDTALFAVEVYETKPIRVTLAQIAAAAAED